MHRHLPISIPDGYYTMDSGGLGFGLPASVGLALGRQGKRVVAILGDGSSLYSIQGLWNAAELSLPISFVILNNGGYARLREFAREFGFAAQEPVQGTNIANLDYAGLARAFGCAASRVSDEAGLRIALQDSFMKYAPCLIEVLVA